MTIVAELDGVSYAIGGNDLFHDISLSISDGDRIGLVGHNGCGKSTLLSLLARTVTPDAGKLRFRRGLRIGAVEQFLPQSLSDTKAVDALAAERWLSEAILGRLGFSTASLSYRVGDLSGGQQNRLMFARAVVQPPELLLLDEPTNHLDLATIVIFEDFLKTLKSAFVLVSHDREFLDAVTTRTVFLRDKRASHFKGSYSDAKGERDRMDQTAELARASEEKKIDALKVSAKRLTTWQAIHGNEKLAKRAKNMQRRIERLADNKTFVTQGSPLDLSIELGATRAKEVIRVTDVDVTVAAQRLFHVDEFLIRPGDRIALLGHNGVGKSTFIRKLVASAKHGIEGYKLSPQTQVGYYDQELDEVHSDKSMADFVRDLVTVSTSQIRNHLIAAGFAYDEHSKRVDVMSGGERARLLFVVLSLQKPNLLVLDEPTNHIDIEGKEQLERDLISSGAAVLITSHDRRFIESVADRFFCIEAGALKETYDPERFFHSKPAEVLDVPAEADEPQAVDPLERIVELEEKLAADQGRKPKFQKPQLQQAWQAELQELYKEI